MTFLMFYYVRHTLKTSRNYPLYSMILLKIHWQNKKEKFYLNIALNRKIESNIIYNSSRNSTYEFE